MTTEHRAIAIGASIYAIWTVWDDRPAGVFDNALTIAAESILALDMTRVPTHIIEPLRYFALAHIGDGNPGGLSHDEMIGAIHAMLTAHAARHP